MGSTGHHRVAGPTEVLCIGQLKIDVSLGGNARAITNGVKRDPVSSMNLVADVARGARGPLVRRCKICLLYTSRCV